jgi:hypothetical protein
MTVTPANLRRAAEDGTPVFAPYATETPSLDDVDYVQEEWIAIGLENGHRYTTTLCVRRPRDKACFSGTVIVEPLHVHGIAPIWMYTAPYIVREGHGWVEVTSQKTTLDMHVKASNPQRYGFLAMDGADSSDFDPNPNFEDPEGSTFWKELVRRNRASSTILAQIGAAIRDPDGPFSGRSVVRTILAGHSQTGSVTTYYIRDAHNAERLSDGSPVYDGYFPSGFPFDPFHDIDVPIVQVLSEGDVPNPETSFWPGYQGRLYRRDDSDEPGDRYRLYELAGVSHMGTRDAPFNDVSLWQANFPGQPDIDLARMNSLPHFELFQMTLDHLIRWVANGTAPPRAERLEAGPDGWFVRDQHQNTCGGVRCVQLDVPHTTYRANPLNPDGTPSNLTVGTEEPFDRAQLRKLYGDQVAYVERFNRRLDELVAAGWLLSDNVDAMRAEAQALVF